ncbi:hypothetical protein BH10PSE18_BH10PSE18_07830 [soil metagenome]
MRVYIDQNVWDFLRKNQIDLLAEFPPSRYSLHIVREQEFEIAPAPDEIRAFIQSTIERCSVKTSAVFGFYDSSLPPDQQRVAGFGVGEWAGGEQIRFLADHGRRVGKELKSKTRLFKNETDLSLGSRAFDSIVLSLDVKAGPIKSAHTEGGYVVFLNQFDRNEGTLGDQVESELRSRGVDPSAFKA